MSAAKGWGNFHATASLGARVPNDLDEETASSHYSLQLDYFVCRYFIPFFSANAFTTLNNAERLPLKTEGYDLINFGSSKAEGVTQATVGGGFRSHLLPRLDLGFGYEAGVTHPKGLVDHRFTLDLIFRF